LLASKPVFQCNDVVVALILQIVRKSTTLYAKSWTRAGISKEEWKELGLVEEDDPEVAQKKESDEPSTVEEIGMLLIHISSVKISFQQCEFMCVLWDVKEDVATRV
jgi:hypothetical protein